MSQNDQLNALNLPHQLTPPLPHLSPLTSPHLTLTSPSPHPNLALGLFRSIPMTQNAQLNALDLVHQLIWRYAQMWQEIEEASRRFESERALTATCMYVTFHNR